MKKKILIIITCILTLTLLTGCGDKKALSAKEFNKISEKEELIITDASEHFEDKEYVKDATIAASLSGWQIEHYTFTSEEEAKKMFDKNKEEFEGNLDEEDKKAVKETSQKNYTIYTVTVAGSYKYLSRIDNTVLYVNTSDSNKDAIEKVINKLGY